MDKSKYVAKGTAIRNLRKYDETNIRPGFFDEKMTAIDHHYQGQILASSWYDVNIFKHLMEVSAQELKWTLRRFCIGFNEFSLKSDLNGVYQFLLKMGGAERVLKSTRMMIKSYTNTIEYNIIKNDKGLHEASMLTPVSIAEFNLSMLEGAMKGILGEVGHQVKNFSHSTHEPVEKDGETWANLHIHLEY